MLLHALEKLGRQFVMRLLVQAFNATKSFENHAIIVFLESIGAEFGACSNAYTSADETVRTTAACS